MAALPRHFRAGLSYVAASRLCDFHHRILAPIPSSYSGPDALLQPAGAGRSARPTLGLVGHFGDVHRETGLGQQGDQFEHFEAVPGDFGLAIDAGFGVGGLVTALEIV